MFENDYVMRMIHDMVRMIAKLFLNKDTVTYEFPEEANFTNTDYLYQSILERLENGDINDAENMLYEKFEEGNERYMEMCLDFYARLNQLSDDYLEEHNYSRDEVEEGLKEIARRNHVDLNI